MADFRPRKKADYRNKSLFSTNCSPYSLNYFVMLRLCLAICLFLLVLSSLPGQTPILRPDQWIRSDRHDGYVLGNGQMYVVAGLGKQLQRRGKSQLSSVPADYNRIAWIIGPSYSLGNLGYGWEPVPLLNQDTIQWTQQAIIQPAAAQRFWGVESQHPELSLHTQDMLLEGEAVFMRAMQLSRPADATPGGVRVWIPVYSDPRNSSYAMFNGQVVDRGQVERWASACGPNLKPRQSIPPEALQEINPEAGSLLLYGANHALWQEVSTTVPDEATYQRLFPYRAAATSVKCESPGSQVHLRPEGFEVDLGELAPGESRWVYLYIATQQGAQTEVGASAMHLLQQWQEQDPAAVFEQQEARQAPFLFTSKDGNPALLQSINACLNLSLACKPLDGGTMAQPYMYPMYYVRDQFGPYKLLLAAGEYAKAYNILQFYIAKQNHEGIQNAHDLFVQTPDPSIWLPEANARNGHHSIAEVPSYIILMAQNYYRATGDLEGIRPFYPRLKYNLAVQQRSINGILPFAGDESYTNRRETVPRYRAEMTDSHLLYLAAAEHAAYRLLHDRLAALTDLPTAAMDRQKGLFDRYFARAPLDDWFGAMVFFAFGIPLARDFMRTVVPMLDADSGDVVLRSLQDRAEVEAAALALLRSELVDEEVRERARRVVADLLGQALASFQQAAGDSDALTVLLGAGEGDDDASGEVRRLAMGLLTAHRGRLVELGLEDPEDLTRD